MPEHAIRLRGPWDLLPPDGDGAEAARVVLPAESLPRPGRPVTIRRRFGRPARGPAQPCRLRLEDVAGLARITLNGETLADRPDLAGAGRPGAIEVPLGRPLAARNVLELTIDAGPAPSGRPWGSISLVFDVGREPSG